MQERADEVRAQYYTEETPLQDANGTLSSGGFTGYVELSENVLSGDYFVVYHGGKSMSAAFVGNQTSGSLTMRRSRRPTTRSASSSNAVDIEPIEILKPPEDETDEQSADPAAAGVDPLDAGDETAATDEPADAGVADAAATGEEEPDGAPLRDDARSDESVETPPEATGTAEPMEPTTLGRPDRSASHRTAPCEQRPAGVERCRCESGPVPPQFRIGRATERGRKAECGQPARQQGDRPGDGDTDTATQTEPTERETGVRETSGEPEPQRRGAEPSQPRGAQHDSTRSSPAQPTAVRGPVTDRLETEPEDVPQPTKD